MRLTNINEIIRFAIRKEADSATFYRMAAERSNPGVKKALEELAIEEESHKKKLENIVLNKEMEIVASDEKKGFSFSEFLQDVPFSSDMSYDEILRMAIKKEENSKNLYLSTSKFLLQNL